MREIKFRAWDKVEKKYWYDIQSVYDSMNAPCCCSSFGHFLTVEITDEYGDVTGEKRFDVEQFTGLYDAIGREIYEGDIVLFPSGIIRTIVFKHCCFGYMLDGGEFVALYSGSENKWKLKIIGNIHTGIIK